MIRKRIILLCLAPTLFLGGCLNLLSNNSPQAENEDGVKGRPSDIYESVLTYTGDGYFLPYGGKAEKAEEQYKDEVVKATKEYIKKEYNTDIEVHNLVGNQDGYTVFFETTGRLHFYSTAIVPIDFSEKKVRTENIGTLDDEVEKGLRTALYAYIKEDEFKILDDQIKDIIDQSGEIVGTTVESIQNTGGNAYETPYYFVQSVSDDEAIKPVYDLYMKNPDASKEELTDAYQEELFDPDDLWFSINLYMKDPKKEPVQEVYNPIMIAFEENDDLPKGHYFISLHDHYVIKKAGVGDKDNSLSQDGIHGIYKK
jgi:Protein of unknown function (DUF1672)